MMVSVLHIIIFIGASTLAISRDVEAGTGEIGPIFYVIELTISPTEAEVGQSVTITISVGNQGDDPGKVVVPLEINGVVETTQEVTVDVNQSKDVTFVISKDVAGDYSVVAGGFTRSFTVKGESTAVSPLLVGGIIAVIIAAGLLIYFLVRRKTA
jgi:hypothetical protein